MYYNLIHSSNSNIFESLSVISSFNLAEKFWDNYEDFAIRKVKDATLKLKGLCYDMSNISPKEATKELDYLNNILPVLHKLRKKIESIKDKEFQTFKATAIEFFDTVDVLYNNLQDIAHIHHAYETSVPVLSNDWDKEEDKHWDNY